MSVVLGSGPAGVGGGGLGEAVAERARGGGKPARAAVPGDAGLEPEIGALTGSVGTAATGPVADVGAGAVAAAAGAAILDFAMPSDVELAAVGLPGLAAGVIGPVLGADVLGADVLVLVLVAAAGLLGVVVLGADLGVGEDVVDDVLAAVPGLFAVDGVLAAIAGLAVVAGDDGETFATATGAGALGVAEPAPGSVTYFPTYDAFATVVTTGLEVLARGLAVPASGSGVGCETDCLTSLASCSL